jgi:precorrin-6A/cobalt-precorrin-6A reductase
MPMMDNQRMPVLSRRVTHQPLRILILGGTSEARALAEKLAGMARFDAVVSLAGRTEKPLPSLLPVRTGGFGGAAGLQRFIAENDMDAVIDATHPFAAQISANAVLATGNTPLIRLTRPAWALQPGDLWHKAADAGAAADFVGDGPEAVFLGMGRLEMPAFFGLKRPALIRTVDPIEETNLPQGWQAITGTGPFNAEEEIALFRAHDIRLVVSKNSGGTASYAKIEAARRLGLPVVMIERPVLAPCREASHVTEVIAWLDTLHRGKTPTERAV